jgi:hypothetical protein
MAATTITTTIIPTVVIVVHSPDFQNLRQHRIILRAGLSASVRQALRKSAVNTLCIHEHFFNAIGVQWSARQRTSLQT